ncbi:MAG: DUF2190 family protein [Desulfuromonadaceae bacterium]|nr:DUF2190 family protein [Desulfuromonadaceae bacterium]
MKHWILNNQFSLITFVALALVVLVGSFAFGADPFTALPMIGMAGAVTVRGPIDQLVTVKYTHTAATVTDTFYLLGGRVLLAVNSVAADAENVFLIRGHVEVDKTAGTAWVGGQAIYWDDSESEFTTVSTDNTKAGFAMEAAASAATAGQLFLEPATNL